MVVTRILRIDLALPEPAYEQIVRSLRGMLVAGQFQPGDPLPPVRQLAVDLGINHNTVAEAYRILANEGWIDLRHGRGATVVARQSPRASPEVQAHFLRRLHELAAKAIADGLARVTISDDLADLAAAIRKGEPL